MFRLLETIFRMNIKECIHITITFTALKHIYLYIHTLSYYVQAEDGF